MKKRDSENYTDITGRDSYIILKALAYASITIERLPDAFQERSDRMDMIAILNATAGESANYFLTTARSHIERRGITVEDGQIALADRKSEDGVVKFPE